MARIQLVARTFGSPPGIPYYRPEDRSNTLHHIPRRRIFIRLFVLPQDAVDRDWVSQLSDSWSPEAIVDTGAPLTIFPFKVWHPFREAIQWLAQPSAGPTGHRVTILGGTFSYRLGRVLFGAFDLEGRWLPAVMSNAWFLEDNPSAPRQAVLGLRTRLFERRQLRCGDVPDDTFEQTWSLEDS